MAEGIWPSDVMTPREIVSELDRYIVGQHDAKRAVAIALRNRWRRQNVAPELRDEIAPKNILMIGPTGVGKTEIARRLARLAQAPFVKVEASRYTEVGYVGRDVESMIRDLAEIAVKMVRDEERERSRSRRARPPRSACSISCIPPPTKVRRPGRNHARGQYRGRRQRFAQRHAREAAQAAATAAIWTIARSKSKSARSRCRWSRSSRRRAWKRWALNMKELMSQLMPKKTRTRKVKIPEALELLTAGGSGAAGRYGERSRTRRSLARSNRASSLSTRSTRLPAASRHGPDVSREGVQRDLLPIVEGSTVNTKYGAVRTDHILFVASGAFHTSKPSDLIPEFQGRFPIRVELQGADARGLHSHPDRARERADPAVRRADGDRGRAYALHRGRRSRRWRRSRRRSTRARKISARAGCIRCSNGCSRSCRSTRRSCRTQRSDDRRRVRPRRLDPIVKDEDLSRYIL